ncbi:MAG: hypothetical protein HQL17_07845 [Candidatus Omnitrophica bacterium]|nr:hypothetical protein [Candidatus Omnitrophota bacterium]
MNKVKLLKVLNVFLLVAFAVQTFTVLVMVLGLHLINPRYIGLIHKFNGLFLVAVAVTHIFLNWGWIRSTYLKDFTGVVLK